MSNDLIDDSVSTPSPELLELEAAGWKRNDLGWYSPGAFMKPCCFEDAVKLNRVIQSWGKNGS